MRKGLRFEVHLYSSRCREKGGPSDHPWPCTVNTFIVKRVSETSTHQDTKIGRCLNEFLHQNKHFLMQFRFPEVQAKKIY